MVFVIVLVKCSLVAGQGFYEKLFNTTRRLTDSQPKCFPWLQSAKPQALAPYSYEYRMNEGSDFAGNLNGYYENYEYSQDCIFFKLV